MKLLFTLAAGWLGAKIALRCKLPAGVMIGSMGFVLLLNLLFDAAYMPVTIRPVLQVLAGCFVGLGIRQRGLADLKRVLFPALLYAGVLLVVSISAGYLIYLLFPMDITTSLLSSMPGGILDMSLLSYEFGASTPQVATLQMMRLVIGFGVFPPLSRYLALKLAPKAQRRCTPGADGSCTPPTAPPQALRRSLYTLAVAFMGGVLGYLSGLPAGVMTFSMAATVLLNIKTPHAYLPRSVKRAAQVVAGALVGSTITKADFLNLRYLLLPFFIILLEYLFISYGVGPLLAKLFHIDLATMFLACNPAGVSDMALIAEELGGDISKVAVFQLVRYVSTIAVFPLVIQLIARLVLS